MVQYRSVSPISDRLLTCSTTGPAPASGRPGELHVGGAGVARGYLNQPELTAQRFIPTPFATQPRAAVSIGRPGSVTARRQHPVPGSDRRAGEDPGLPDRAGRDRGRCCCSTRLVREAARPAREDQPGDKRLAAYVVPRDPLVPLSELRAFLTPTLARIHDSLSLRGAVRPAAHPQRQARSPGIAGPDRIRPDLATGYVPPRDPGRGAVGGASGPRFLGLERVGIHDNFFELGGHSLLATRPFSRIELEFGRSDPPRVSSSGGEMIAELSEDAHELAGDSYSYRSTCRDSKPGQSRRPPLFLVHAMDGDVGHLRRLTECLGPRYRRLWPEASGAERRSVNPSPPSVPWPPITSIGSVTFSPKGPYHIAGYSFVRRVSLEIAQQLASRGRHVGLVGAIDSGPIQQEQL